jgi:hypothetical protein
MVAQAMMANSGYFIQCESRDFRFVLFKRVAKLVGFGFVKSVFVQGDDVSDDFVFCMKNIAILYRNCAHSAFDFGGCSSQTHKFIFL